MCFSATASFTAGTTLTVVGSLTVRKSQGKRELPFALVPLLFGIQQLTEGALWVSLEHGLPLLQTWSTDVYSIFSHVLWPIFVPFAVLLIEAARWRRRVLTGIVVLGLSVGLYLLFFIVRFPVTATVEEHSIRYESPHFYIAAVLVVYLVATCASPLFSSHRWVNIFGALAFGLAIVAAAVSVTTFVSVWCFYAAVLSAIVYRQFSGPMQSYRSALTSARPAMGS
jgi:hypothetical protein